MGLFNNDKIKNCKDCGKFYADTGVICGRKNCRINKNIIENNKTTIGFLSFIIVLLLLISTVEIINNKISKEQLHNTNTLKFKEFSDEISYLKSVIDEKNREISNLSNIMDSCIVIDTIIIEKRNYSKCELECINNGEFVTND